MKQVIHKVYWLWQFEDEEQWLNEMSAKGLHLTDVGLFRYVFEEGTPGAYQYRLEMLDHWPNHPESRKYIAFLEETGAEHVGSLKNWVYFRKRGEDGPFDLYSDIDSRIRHLQRIAALLATLVACLGVSVLCYFMGMVADGFHSELLLSLLLLSAFEALLAGGLYRIEKKRRELKREREIRE
ncbi:MAG: DUF2812 domain-containing protein [Oscillospiraceae bacterium]